MNRYAVWHGHQSMPGIPNVISVKQVNGKCPDKVYFKRQILIEDEKKIPCFSIYKLLRFC